METTHKKIHMPHVLILLLGIVFICSLLTYIIPAGSYETIVAGDGREVIDPTTYSEMEQTPVTLMQFLTAVPRGLNQSAPIVFLIFMVGGSFAVLQSTGAIEGALSRLAKLVAGKELLAIPLVILLLACGSSFIGMAEELLVFVPITVSLALALGFDSFTGIAMALCGWGAGFAGAVTNPFTVCVAQGFAGLPLFSGSAYRMLVFAVMVCIPIIYTMRYAARIKKNPELSGSYEQDCIQRSASSDMHTELRFEVKEKLILLVFLAAMVLLVVGVTQWGWYLNEISALFLGMAMLSAMIGRTGFNNFAVEFGKGMADISGGAIIVGFSSAVLVVLTDGNIIHTILNATAGLLGQLPSMVSAMGMYVFQCILNFLIPSGSGQAAVSIPIMAPLGDLVGVTRQTAVLAYQMGDGISNIILPTNGILLAGLSMSKIPWEKWAKWLLPVILLQYLMGAVLVAVAQGMHYGPF